MTINVSNPIAELRKSTGYSVEQLSLVSGANRIGNHETGDWRARGSREVSQADVCSRNSQSIGSEDCVLAKADPYHISSRTSFETGLVKIGIGNEDLHLDQGKAFRQGAGDARA